MTKKHSYTNPEDKFDASYVEAQVTEGKKYYDKDGWEISPPISDRECIYRCLENCEESVSYTHLTLPTKRIV